ncbi:hypothetical protein [Yinghuangia seranimata]|uniref:hypothetical protein n=1 Tax=Yinghuangia seranimata TaxID=408067 RepID=UPI00248C299F|nr:hypothetical protein [Yinghuangia seranimata]MDI2128399.1 hypothetical protein [Yinghuangia seranimata]
MVAVGAVAALGLGLNAGFAQAASLKVPLTTANINCDGSSAGGTGTGPGTGFVVYNTPSSGTLIANVVLQNARANTTYNVRLIQSAATCGQVDGTITTDSFGNGSVNIKEPDIGTTAFVAVNNTNNPADDYFTTQVVPT